MARLVTKFKYLRPSARQNVGGYARYIATREGVEKIVVEPYQPYQIIVDEHHISDFGPIVLLQVWD